MNKGYVLHFDLQEKGVNPLNPHMIFNELDNNTSDFFIVVTSGGKEVDIENADVTLAIIKPSGEAESQSIEIKDNCIYGNLKSYMKNEVGNYVASILLILDDQKVIIDEITYTITEDNVFRLLNDTVKEDERFPILTNMLNELYDIKIKEKQRELNEEQRIENENNRQNIFESKVNEVNSKINEVNKSKNEIVNTFNTLTAQQQQDAEVITARDGEVSLKARLDRDLNNLNKELDRVKKIEESKVSTIQTESNFTTVEETSNGYFEDIKLEGKTLVNKKPNNTRSYSITINSQSQYPSVEYTNLEIGKKYTVISDMDSTKFKMAIYKNNGVQSIIPYSSSNILSFTVPNDATNNIRVYFCVNDPNTSDTTINIIMLEGDHTNNPPEYFEGIKSVAQDVDEITIKSVNGDANLFDENVLNKYITSPDEDSFTLDYLSMYRDNFIYPIKTKGQHIFRYTCKETVGNKDPRFMFVYKDGSIDHINNKTTSEFVTYEMASNVNKELIGIKSIYYGNGGNWVIKKNSIMLSKGTESKPFKPYQENKKTLLYYNEETQTWEKPILREWDSIEKHSDGKYYYNKKSGEIILNGSENWILSDSKLTNTIRFIITSYLPGQAKVNTMFLCDTLSFDRSWYDKDVEGYTITNESGHIYIRINRSKLSTQDVAGFKAWLQANPTTIVYQLAQEKIYECTNIDLITYENETNYIIESGSITPKTTLKVHNNISNIVRLLQSKVSMLENNMTDYMVTQNRLLLSNRYSTDNVEFSVNTATFSLDDTTLEYDNDLYNLILNNILVGKENYDRSYMENLIQFYWLVFIISDEMYFTLSSIIEEQHTEQEDITMEESPTE